MKRFLPLLAALLLSAAAARGARAADDHWPPAPGDGFEPDVNQVHPTVGAALYAAGRYAATAVRKVGVGDGGQTIGLYVEIPDDRYSDLIEKAIRADDEGISVRAAGPGPSARPADGDVRVEVRVNEASPQDVRWAVTPVARGAVAVRVVGPRATESAAVRYQERPWVYDFDAFKTASVGRQWVRGESTRPCATADEAARVARESAAQALAARVRDTTGIKVAPDNRLFRDAVANLGGGRWVADRHTARYRRDYGTVYYETILVDASPTTLNELTGRVVHQVRVEQAARLTRVGGGIIMAGVIGVLYLLVNALTKGYFAGRLRAAAVFVLLLVAGVLLLVGA